MSLELLLYGGSGLFCLLVVVLYIRREQRNSGAADKALQEARARGRNEPVSLHPRVDPARCLGSGACVRACPEKSVLGLVNNKAVLINASSCIGHGACEAACPVEAIDLVFGTAKRGVDLPRIRETFETNVPGLYIAGELGGMGLIRNAVTQGRQAVEAIRHSLDRSAASATGESPDLDLIIIGAGPAGLSAALQAQVSKVSARILEQDSPGGTILNYPRRKLVMTQPMQLPGEEALNVREISKEDLLDRFQGILDRRRPEICCGEQVVEIRPEGGNFRILTRQSDGNASEHQAKRVLLTIGRRGTPRRMGVEGEHLSLVHYQLREPEAFAGMDCVVLGGGDSAIEGSLRLASAGAASVHLVHRGNSFARARIANQDALRHAVEEGRIALLLDAVPLRVHATSIEIRLPDGSQDLPAGLVLVQIGGELPTGLLQRAGILIDTHFGQEIRRGDAA